MLTTTYVHEPCTHWVQIACTNIYTLDVLRELYKLLFMVSHSNGCTEIDINLSLSGR